ncbi:MAG: tRNA 2-thiouridine(34) synthase MnmA, partial [Lachnospiraceae bacterium]|nr:tRNA 2-thiouridine(34) synthase MnmA [Lachnospiraceae bacterium]
LAKIRYSHKGAMCMVHCEGERLRLEFDEPQRAATPGQAVVFYKEEETTEGETVVVVAGGGVICR